MNSSRLNVLKIPLKGLLGGFHIELSDLVLASNFPGDHQSGKAPCMVEFSPERGRRMVLTLPLFFPHRRNRGGSFDSISLKCLATIANERADQEEQLFGRC